MRLNHYYFIAAAAALGACSGARERKADDVDHLFLTADLNHDSCLSRQEWIIMVDRGTQKLPATDADNPGFLKASYIEAFVKLDLDGDGCVRAAEYRKSIAKVRQEADRLAN